MQNKLTGWLHKFFSVSRNIAAIVLGGGFFFLATLPFSHDFHFLYAESLDGRAIGALTVAFTALFALLFHLSTILTNYVCNNKCALIIVGIADYSIAFWSTILGLKSHDSFGVFSALLLFVLMAACSLVIYNTSMEQLEKKLIKK